MTAQPTDRTTGDARLAAAQACVGERFELVRPLAEGGMGSVYEALDKVRGERVALKILRHVDADSVYRFKREFRALADHSHPNLVALFELFANDTGWFFTMELVHGTNLLAWGKSMDEPTLGAPISPGDGDPPHPHAEGDLGETRKLRQTPSVALSAHASGAGLLGEEGGVKGARRAIDEGRLRPVLTQLARALVALHSTGSVHRDVKASNVMVDETGRVVVLDFGIIAAMGASAERDDAIVGTPAYMAPEQTIPGYEPTPASDWYSFGVMLYEMLAGRRPFLGTTTQVLAAKMCVAPPSLDDLAPGAPSDLAALCSDLLSVEPADRPNGADVLRRLAADTGGPPGSDPSIAQSLSLGLVGRSEQLALLHAALARAHGGHAGAAFVHGPSGMGKTALIEGFLAEVAHDETVLVLQGRCYERESVPYKALDSLVDALCRELVEMSSKDVERVLPDDTAALAAAFPVLMRVPTLAARVRASPVFVREIKRRALRALASLVERLAEDRAVVLFIDDLQWGDADSAPLFADLVRLERARILLLGTYRTEQRDASPLLAALLRRADGAVIHAIQEIALLPLSTEDLSALARVVLRGGAPEIAEDAEPGAPPRMLSDVVAPLAERIALEAGGSPYFALELARHAASRVDIDDHPSLHAVIRARVRELSSDAQSALETVVVAGAPLARRIVERAAGLMLGRGRTFVELVTASFVKQSGSADAALLEPLHDAVREALLREMTVDDQRSIHLALANALEQEDVADVHALARHYFEARERAPAPRAFAACRAAGVVAATSYAFEQAYTHLDRARQIAENAGLPRDVAFDQALGEAAARSGHIEAAVASLQRGLSASTSGLERAQLRLELAKIYLAQLDSRASLAECSRGLVDAGVNPPSSSAIAVIVSFVQLVVSGLIARVRRPPEADDEALRVHRLVTTLLVQFGLTRYFQMDRLGQVHSTLRLGRVVSKLGAAPEVALWTAMAGGMCGVLGMRARSERLGSRAIALAAELGDPVAKARALQFRAHSLNFLGDVLAAERVMAECLTQYGHALENADFLTATADLAGILLLRGRTQEGMRWVERGLARTAVDGEGSLLTQGHTYRCYAATLLALLGRPDEGKRHLDEFGALLVRGQDDRWREAQWLAHRALFHSEVPGDPAELETIIDEFHALGIPPRKVPLQIRHFYIAQAKVRLEALDGSPAADLRWTRARAELAAAASHPTFRAHLLVFDAAYSARRGDHARAALLRQEAAVLAEETDNALVKFELALQRAANHERRGEDSERAAALAEAAAFAEAEGWTLRRAALRAATR